jgi:hypothetical protein
LIQRLIHFVHWGHLANELHLNCFCGYLASGRLPFLNSVFARSSSFHQLYI